MKKRILCIFLTVCMLFALATPALAAETIESGQCGNNLNWSLTSDGTLTISGTGDMWDYEYGEDMRPTSPWYKYWDSDLGTELKALVISDGVTSIGDYSFRTALHL